MNSQPITSFGLLVQEQLARLQSRQIGCLRFSSVLEGRFESDLAPARSRRLFIESWILTGIYTMTLLGDYKAIPSRFALALVVRLCFVLPLMMAANELFRHNPRQLFREGSIILTAVVVVFGNCVIYHDLSAAISAGSRISILIALLVTNIVMRVRLPYAMIATVFCIATNIAFLILDTQLSTPEKMSFGVPVVLGSFFILLAAYSLERQERVAYLLQLRHEIQSKELTSANVALKQLSSQDGLTGLANRITFERQYEKLWQQATEANTPLSIVILDIDHFKIVNDTQGHLYGDEVIRRVSALLRQSLRGKDDFVARYGGEEFVLLLPDADVEAAHIVAERARKLIQLAGSPAPAQKVPEPGLWMTVSCGVATVMQVGRHTRRELLAAADTALYAAKAEGRNRVCVAPNLGRWSNYIPTTERRVPS